MKIGRWDLSIEDLSYAFMAFVLMGFHSVTILLMLSQILCFGVQVLSMFKDYRTMRIPKHFLIYLCWFFIFLGYAGGSFLWSLCTKSHLSFVLSIIQAGMVSLSSILYVQDRKRFEKAVFFLTIGGLLLCLRMLVQVPFKVWGTERVGTYVGLGNVQVTYTLSYVAIFTFYEGLRKKNLFAIGSSFVMVLFSVLSGSKKALIVAAVSIFLIVVFRNPDYRKILIGLLVGTVLIVLMIFAVYKIPVLYTAIGKRFERMFAALQGTGRDGSTATRLRLIGYAWNTFKSYPILGVGLDAFRHLNPQGLYAHNNYLELLASLGILGFLIYYSLPIGVLITAIYRCFKQHCSELIAAVAVMVSILAMDIASVSYMIEWIQLCMALCFAYLFINERSTL